MPANFLHGVEVIEVDIGPRPVRIVKSAVIGLVGAAPTWAVESPLVAPAANAPTLVSSKRDASRFGPLIRGYSIPYALRAIQDQGAGQVIVVNVFNPATHIADLVAEFTFPATGPQVINLAHMGVSNLGVRPPTTTPVTDQARVFAGTPGTITLANQNIKSGTVVVTTDPAGTTYTEGTDYTVNYRTGVITRAAAGTIPLNGAVLVDYSYYSGAAYVLATDYTADLVNGVVTAKSGGAIAAGASVAVSFSFADPSKVAAADIIGAVVGSVFTGIEAFDTTFNKMGFFPKILIAPGYAAAAAVASALISKADKLRAIALLDSPAAVAVADAIAARGLAGDPFNTSSKRAVLCYPQQKFFDTGIVPTGVTLSAAGAPVIARANAEAVQPYSQWVAGATASKDLDKGYWFSPSNTEIRGVLGPDVDLYASLVDALSDVNQLNEQGIVTVFNAFASGMRVWGNRSAAWPTITTPDNFIAVRRTLDVIEESMQLAMLQYIDLPITNALIVSILQDANAFLRTLIGRGALVGGEASYDPGENPPEEIAAGHLVFDLAVMPPPPAERITFQVFIDTNLLRNLGQSEALSA